MCDLCGLLSRRGFCGAALALPLAPAPARPAGLLEPQLRLCRAGGGARRVAVTLDACPGAFDARIALMLVQRKIPVTIFLTATWMRWNPRGLAFFKARSDIFALENHGGRHLPAVLGTARVYGLAPAGSLAAIRDEVLAGSAAVTPVTGATPGWYRGAAGLYSPVAIPLIEGLGFRIAGYSLNADQGASLPAAAVAARISAARDGEVIVGHINQPKRASGAGIAAGLAALQEAGTIFVRLDQAA